MTNNEMLIVQKHYDDFNKEINQLKEQRHRKNMLIDNLKKQKTPKEVYVVLGYNGILKTTGPVGVATSEKKANEILKDHAYMLDDSKIIKTPLEV